MGWRQDREITEDDFLVVGCDTSQGGKDYSTAIFISKTHLDISSCLSIEYSGNRND